MTIFGTPTKFDLKNHGLRNLSKVYWNLFPPALIEQIIIRNEGEIGEGGVVVVQTGRYTGRSPKDKYIVKNPEVEIQVNWGPLNQPISPVHFEQIHQKMIKYLEGKDIFVQDIGAGTDKDFRINIRVITEKAWHSLFTRDLFLHLSENEYQTFIPEFTLIDCPNFHADPETDGTASGTLIILNFQKKLILIGGTDYAGEIKKSVFSLVNFLMPLRGVLPMHCAANVDRKGDIALFFGLSGTGKTTLSSDPERYLIGDDEHGWTDGEIFNFEGGCYAKVIHLKENREPLIWKACHHYGTILENVVLNSDTNQIDFDSDKITENTRAAYPLEYIPNSVSNAIPGAPRNIFFLTADAYGVLPPISRLLPNQAQYYFLSGYTSKLAGTEKDLSKEPLATFSTCFGAPFLPLRPSVYADLLEEKCQKNPVTVWLVNTGWTGGPYGVGNRIKLEHTRALISQAVKGGFEQTRFIQESYFGLWVPETCPNVPTEILTPSTTWSDQKDYEATVASLIRKFEENANACFMNASPEVLAAGPHSKN